MGLTMNALFNIELTINMPDSCRLSRQLLNLYCADLPGEIKAVAFELCAQDLAVLTRKFDNLNLKRSETWTDADGSLKFFVLLSVSGEEAAFIRQVITKYMSHFPECLKHACEVHFSRTPFPPGIALQPTDWSLELHQV
jgi:hypothetical protein